METPKTKIQFKPVHDGMGFHPFSDGLPYAPQTAKPTAPAPVTPKPAPVSTTGLGATAAGRPQFVTQTIRPHVRPYTPKPIQRLTPPQPAVETKAPPVEMISDQALLRRRAFAYILDSIIHAGFWLLTNLAALMFFHFQIDSEIFRDNWPQFIAFYAVSQWLFIGLQESLFGTSMGKTFFNLEFKRNHRSLLLRSMVFMLGLAFFGLGLYFRPQDKFGEITYKSKIET